jgi:DNA helicase-2/ATP-dependent DNA helicase PcrA
VKNIGHSKSQAIMEWLKESGSAPGQVDGWPGAGKGSEGLKPFSRLMKHLSREGLGPRDAVEAIIEYYEPILKEKFDDFPRRRKDLEQLVSMGGRYQKMRAFLDDLLLEPPASSADLVHGGANEVLTLSTVHSAKGLEWSCVIIIWVMEGYFPSARAGGSEEGMEEERRLMYVAATRAKDTLILCYPGEEPPPAWHAFGNAGMGYGNGLSSFIQALPQEVMELGSSGARRVLSPVTPKPQRRVERQRKTFSPSGLRSGDRVSHPAFGPGVISKFVDSEKVEVLFRDAGRKLLHLGYTTLEKT